MLTAGTWIPLELAISHYTACDGMSLSTAEIETMGKEISVRTQKTFVGTVASVAVHAGVTPWSVLSQMHRLASRIFDGTDQCVYKIGPKDALGVLVACPLLRVPYFRTAFRTYYEAILGARRIHGPSREVSEYRRTGVNQPALRVV